MRYLLRGRRVWLTIIIVDRHCIVVTMIVTLLGETSYHREICEEWVRSVTLFIAVTALPHRDALRLTWPRMCLASHSLPPTFLTRRMEASQLDISQEIYSPCSVKTETHTILAFGKLCQAICTCNRLHDAISRHWTRDYWRLNTHRGYGLHYWGLYWFHWGPWRRTRRLCN